MRIMRTAMALAMLAFVMVISMADSASPFLLRNGQRVVFLGDSNTNAGMYVQYIDAYLRTRFPDQKFDLLNLGLSSETCSGLSEPDHPFPRPDVHERLDRVLTKTKPDVVVACYGMNDGIYYPFSEVRFAKYQVGIDKLIDKVKRAGAKVTLITPPPFDPQPLRDKVLPVDATKFSWITPYAGYDEVLSRYSGWLLTLRRMGIPVADAHTAVNDSLAGIRRTDASYHLAGDGVHINARGHWLVAQQLLQTWNAPADGDETKIDAKKMKTTRGTVSDLKSEQGTIFFKWQTRLPMPIDPGWDRHSTERGNRHRLLVSGLTQKRYELFENDTRLGEVTRAQLAEGVDLLGFSELTANRRSAELFKLVQQRERLLSAAWLTDIGHLRPNTPKGLPLAEAQRQTAPLEEQLRKLAQPTMLQLRMVPL